MQLGPAVQGARGCCRGCSVWIERARGRRRPVNVPVHHSRALVGRRWPWAFQLPPAAGGLPFTAAAAALGGHFTKHSVSAARPASPHPGRSRSAQRAAGIVRACRRFGRSGWHCRRCRRPSTPASGSTKPRWCASPRAQLPCLCAAKPNNPAPWPCAGGGGAGPILQPLDDASEGGRAPGARRRVEAGAGPCTARALARQGLGEGVDRALRTPWRSAAGGGPSPLRPWPSLPLPPPPQPALVQLINLAVLAFTVACPAVYWRHRAALLPLLRALPYLPPSTRRTGVSRLGAGGSGGSSSGGAAGRVLQAHAPRRLSLEPAAPPSAACARVSPPAGGCCAGGGAGGHAGPARRHL